MNAFHGRTPTLSEIGEGGPDSVTSLGEGRALFLCYPPLDDPMGHQSVANYKYALIPHHTGIKIYAWGRQLYDQSPYAWMWS